MIDASSMMRRWFEWVLAHRKSVLGLLAVGTLVAMASLSQAVIATSMVKLFLGDDPAYTRYTELVPRFGSDEVLLMGYEADELMAPAQLDRLAQVTQAITALPDVARVQSVLDAQKVDIGPQGLSVTRYADLAREADPEAVALALAKDPRASGLIISRDGRHGAVIIELKHNKDRPAEQGPALVAEVQALFTQHGFEAEGLHAAGFLAMIASLLRATLDNILTLFPLTVLVMVVSVQFLLRRLLPVIVSTGVALLAVVWTMGFSTALDPEINIMVGLVPAVVLVVAISDVVHLWSAYLLELGSGHDREEAILRSAADVGVACLLTSITTFVGFLSLAFIPTPIYRHLGLVMGFGVAVALVLAMTLMPILLSWLPAPEVGPARESIVDRGLDAFVAWVGRVTVSHRVGIIVAFSLALVPLGWGIATFEIDSDPLARMAKGSRIQQDATWFEDHFMGTNILELFVEVPEGEDVTDPAVLQGVAKLSDALTAWPEIDAVVSLADVIEETHAAFAPDLAATSPIPDDAGIIGEYLFLFDMAGEEGLDQLVDADHTTLHLITRLKTTALLETYEIGEKARALGPDYLPEGVQLEPSGLTYLFGGFLDELVAGQGQALVFSILSVAALMILGLRSFSVGMWSMIPNVLPTVVVLGVLGLSYDRVDSDSLIAVLMAIGIGVDDTIHFLMRYRLESARHPPAEAIARTFRFAGRAIILTTAILAAGFLPLAFSDYLSIRLLGQLLPIALVVALVADLILLPALTAMGWVRFTQRPAADSGASSP